VLDQALGQPSKNVSEDTMAEGLNNVVLIGSLGADAEMRTTQSGQFVLNFRMATTESYFDNNTKERKEDTQWHSIVLWGARAKALEKILVKGKQVSVVGSLQTSSYEKEGQKHYQTKVKVKNLILLGSGNGKGRQDSDSNNGGANTGNYDAEGFSDDGSEIPF